MRLILNEGTKLTVINIIITVCVWGVHVFDLIRDGKNSNYSVTLFGGVARI